MTSQTAQDMVRMRGNTTPNFAGAFVSVCRVCGQETVFVSQQGGDRPATWQGTVVGDSPCRHGDGHLDPPSPWD